MTPTSEQRHATFALRTLLDDAVPPGAGAALDWPLLKRLAERNAVLVRLADRLECAGVELPPAFAAARSTARARGEGALEVIAALSAACARHGIAVLFPTALEHYPDVGEDLDLLVPSETSDALILGALPATRRFGGVRDWLAGATTYRLARSGLVVDIRHGGLGIVGEHRSYAATVIANRRVQRIGTTVVSVPAAEDQVVLQGMRRVYARRSFRVSDVVTTVGALRAPGLDWGYVIGTARALGLFPGLSCYLSYVDQLHRVLYGRELIPSPQRNRLTLEGWGPCAFRGGVYRFPAARVGSRLYGHELATLLRTRNWATAARLALFPAALVADQVRRLAGSGRSRSVTSADTPPAPPPPSPRWA